MPGLSELSALPATAVAATVLVRRVLLHLERRLVINNMKDQPEALVEALRVLPEDRLAVRGPRKAP